MTPLLDVRDLELQYTDGSRALAGVKLSVGRELVGLLGPNGAGKTTLLNVLARRLLPQRGQGQLLGAALERASQRTAWLSQVGYLPQDDAPPQHLSGLESVELALGLTKPWLRRRELRQRSLEALERVGLADAARRRAIGYSGGMRRRLGLARVLACEPALLLIDEPTSGLDPDERVAFRELLAGLAEISAVIVSTHIAADVEVSCSRVLVFLAGRIIWDGSPSSLVSQAVGSVRQLETDEPTARELASRLRVTSLVSDGQRVRVRFVASPDDDAPPGELVTPSLEEAYVEVIERAQAQAVRA